MSNPGVLNLELGSYHSLGDGQEAMQNKSWLQEPNYSPTQRGTNLPAWVAK